MLLGKIKLYDIAKELNLTSKEVLEIARNLNINAKSHLSAVDETEAEKIRENAKKTNKKPEEKKINSNEKAKANTDSPVIIRREVIINDDTYEQIKNVIESKIGGDVIG